MYLYIPILFYIPFNRRFQKPHPTKSSDKMMDLILTKLTKLMEFIVPLIFKTVVLILTELNFLTKFIIPLIFEPPSTNPSYHIMPRFTNPSDNIRMFILHMWIESIITIVSAHLLGQLYFRVLYAFGYPPRDLPESATIDYDVDTLNFGILTSLLGISLIFSGSWAFMPIYFFIIAVGFSCVAISGLVLLQGVDEDLAAFIPEFWERRGLGVWPF